MEIFSDDFLNALADKVSERIIKKLGMSVDTQAHMNTNKKLLTGTEVCQMLGISSSTLNRRIKEGELEKTYVGGKVMFREEAIENYLNSINYA